MTDDLFVKVIESVFFSRLLSKREKNMRGKGVFIFITSIYFLVRYRPRLRQVDGVANVIAGVKLRSYSSPRWGRYSACVSHWVIARSWLSIAFRWCI